MDSAQKHLGLTLGEDPVATLQQIGRADIERREFLTAAAYSAAAAALPLGFMNEYAGRAAKVASGATAGDAEIAAARDIISLFTAIDERYGGQHGRSAVIHYLTTDLAALTRAKFRTLDQHAAMLSIAACGAYLAGWKAYDADEHGLAQRYYLQAYRLTREAGNDAHAGFVLRILAHHGMDAEQPAHTLALADRAYGLVKGRVDPATEATFVITRARALAVAGSRRRAAAEIARAERMAAGADETTMPYWAAQWGSARACVDSHAAKTLRQLGDYAGAERHYAHSAARRCGTEYQRINALTVASQAQMQCRQGKLDEACATWGRALDGMAGVRSARVRKSVSGMRTDLARLRSQGVAAARDLEERCRGLLAQRLV